MKRNVLGAVVLAALALSAPAALADNGPTTTTPGSGTGSPSAKCQGGSTTTPTLDTSQIQSDISKLDSDIQSRHSGLDADIQALTADAQGGAAIDTLKADRSKIQSDFDAAQSVVKADRSQVESDVKSLVQSVGQGCGARKTAHDQIQPLLQSAKQALQSELAQFKTENEQLRDAAKAAVQQDRQGHKGQGGPGKPPTTTTTP
ncbi:MAG: hypothetical protein JOY72_10565 [Actinobacteria bacterium]|nr:hypothetical protein [Actinomycetota bacterium]MBV8597940.1 hypothetical protein [Actinomycetota bacterium]